VTTQLSLTLGVHDFVIVDDTGAELWRTSHSDAESTPFSRIGFDVGQVHAIRATISHHCSEGVVIWFLREVGRLLDQTACDGCELRFAETAMADLARVAQHAGLEVIEHGDTFRIRRAPMSAESRNLVSVLIAAYNPRYLSAALESVAQQTWSPLEIIVCDDCPTDAVKQVVDTFAGRSKLPIRYSKNPERFGVRRNYEQCFAMARGEFCKFLNDDDVLEPTCIEQLVNALRRCPSASLATSHRRRIDERGFPLNDQPATSPITQHDCVIDGISLINALMMLGLNFVGEPSTTLFRTHVARVGDEPLIHFLGDMSRGVADLTLWSKLALRGDCAFLTERLSSFRIHTEQQTQATNVSQLALTAIPALRSRWLALRWYEQFPPNVLRTLTITGFGTAHDSRPWEALPLRLYSPTNESAAQMIANWRSRRHPFFESETAK
jgi:hypothetical protein